MGGRWNGLLKTVTFQEQGHPSKRLVELKGRPHTAIAVVASGLMSPEAVMQELSPQTIGQTLVLTRSG